MFWVAGAVNISTSPWLTKYGLPPVVVKVATALPAAKATVPMVVPFRASVSVTAALAGR